MPTSNSSQAVRLRSIEGRHNTLLKELRKAFAGAELTSDNCCAIEGLRVVEEAIRSGLKFRAVFFSASARNQTERLLPQLGAHVETVVVPDKLFESTVSTESPQGVAALAFCKKFSLEDVLARIEFGPLIAVTGLQDPGNLGTILRSAEAFSAAGVLLGEGTVSPYNPKVVRASAGSIFRLPVVKVKIKDVLPELREAGLRLFATSSHKGTLLAEAGLGTSAAIFIGGEGAGLGRHLIAEMDEVVAIPHSPKVESLNAGVAASIVLYEAARQKNSLSTEARSHGEKESLG